MTGYEVLDSVVNIDLVAAIAAVSGYYTLRLTHKHETDKDTRLHHRQISERKCLLYVDYLTTSHVLVQKYRDIQCRADEDDYFAYLRLYHELEIVADDPLRVCAFNLLNAVNEFIVFRKNLITADDRELFRLMRARVDEVVGEFQYLAKQDINGLVRAVAH